MKKFFAIPITISVDKKILFDGNVAQFFVLWCILVVCYNIGKWICEALVNAILW